MRRYRHRETGTVAMLVTWACANDVHTVTLECLEDPRRHYEEAFPFKVVGRPHYADLGSPYLRIVALSVGTEPLTIPAEQLDAEWERVQ